MNHLSLFLSLRYLQSKKIVLLSILAVAMSCALLIAVASLFTGFIKAFENGASEHMGDVVISALGPKIQDFDDLLAMLQEHPDIRGATAVLSGQGLLLIGKGDVRAAQVWGIDLAERSRITSFREFLLRQQDAREPSFAMEDVEAASGGFVGIGVISDPDEITDEYDNAAILEEYIGKRVMLTTGRARVEPQATQETASSEVRFKRQTLKFTITDIVFTGVHDMDENTIYLPIEVLSQSLYPDQGTVADMIQIRLSSGVAPPQGKIAVQTVWNQWSSRHAYIPASIKTSQEIQAVLAGEYRKQMQMLMLIFGVVSVGAILLIFCIFYLIVMTKRKDVAIVKSCGMGSWSVAWLYIVFGFGIGVVGAILGAVLGILVTHNVNPIERWIGMVFGLKLWKSSTYLFSRIPNEVDLSAVVWVSLAAILAAGIGALIPAVAAARVRPVRLLRYE
ncbi:MAG: ABC transporter permease [Sedimentisphaerales bacterium]|nr:ABC transporter permease [Sedimentisphaerales bacterium]